MLPLLDDAGFGEPIMPADRMITVEGEDLEGDEAGERAAPDDFLRHEIEQEQSDRDDLKRKRSFKTTKETHLDEVHQADGQENVEKECIEDEIEKAAIG